MENKRVRNLTTYITKLYLLLQEVAMWSDQSMIVVTLLAVEDIEIAAARGALVIAGGPPVTGRVSAGGRQFLQQSLKL